MPRCRIRSRRVDRYPQLVGQFPQLPNAGGQRGPRRLGYCRDIAPIYCGRHHPLDRFSIQGLFGIIRGEKELLIPSGLQG